MAFIPLFCQSHYSPLGVSSCSDLVRRARDLGYPAIGLCDEATMAGFHEFDEACRQQGIRPIFGCRLHIEGFVLDDRNWPVDFVIETEQGYRNLVRIMTQYEELKTKQTRLPRKLSLKGRTEGLWAVLPPDGELAALVAQQDRERTESCLNRAQKYLGDRIVIGLEPVETETFAVPEMLRRNRALEEPARQIALIGDGTEPIPDSDDDSTESLQWSRGWDELPSSQLEQIDDTTSYPAHIEALDTEDEGDPDWDQRAWFRTAPTPTDDAGTTGFSFESTETASPMEVRVQFRSMLEFARKRCMAAPRVYFCEPSDAPAFMFLRCPQGAPGLGWDPPENEKALPALFGEHDYVDRYSPHEQDLAEMAGEIASTCTWRPGLNRRAVPVQDFERGFDPNSYLLDLAIRGAAERYGEITPDIKERINREYEEIKKNDLAPFLLLYREIIEYLDREKISRGVGRGPVLASVLAYCIGITRLEPLTYRLADQPLIGEGQTFPVIRIEIPSHAVPRVIEWLKSHYGESHLARIGRRLDTRRDQILRDLAEWSGLTHHELKLALEEKGRRKSQGAAQRLAEQAASRSRKRWRDPEFIAALATRLSPRPRQLQPSNSGWTLSAEPLDFAIPAWSYDDGFRVTDVEDAALDRLGYPRIEFVPHLLLNMLDRARSGIERTGPAPDLGEISLTDKGTFELLARGDTTAIPPLENVTMRCLLRRDKPGNLLHLLKAKTEANRARSRERPPRLLDELADVLLSFQLAWFKVHYPEAFFAAALSSASEIDEDVNQLTRALRRKGIALMPPDINLSGATSAVFDQRIQLGLLMVRLVGEKAFAEILRARQGGPISSLSDFCSRVMAPGVNLRVAQNLVAAGAFDRFGQTRASMYEYVSRYYRRNRGNGDDGRHSHSISMFDPEEFEDNGNGVGESLALQEIRWDRDTRAEKEIAALGFTTDGDAFDQFPRIMNCFSPLDPGEVTPRQNKKSVVVAGIITDVDLEGPLMDPAGGALIDLEGLPVHLTPQLTRLSQNALQRGEAALIIGDVDTSHGYLRLEAQGVWLASNLEEQAQRVVKIRLRLNHENKTTLKHLLSLTKEYRGDAELELTGYEGSRGVNYRMLAARRVTFCSPFYQRLCNILPHENIELFDAEGHPLVISTTRSPGS